MTLEIKGGKENHQSDKPQNHAPEDKPKAEKKPAISPEELRTAWEKLESYHPLTEQALGEVLEAFLEGRK